MKKYMYAILLLLIITPLAHAQSTKKDTTRLPLWKVSSAKRTMYVTDAMNIPLNTRPVPKRTAQAFAQSGTLVMEGEIGPKAEAKGKALLKKYEPLPESKTLDDILNEIQLRRVKKLLAAVGVNYSDVQHDQPWAVLMHFVHAAEKKSGRKRHPRYRHFKHQAKQQHMSIEHLDTPKQEIEMLANMPSKLQVAFLMMPVNQAIHPRRAVHNKQATRKAWSTGDTQNAAKHFDATFKDYPGLYQAMVTSRHNRWTKMLTAMLAKSGKPVFVVVGAPHLFGPHNLLGHLRKAGYTVTQL
jgi:uncharacterized protein YbaP (TraB family)